MGASDIPAARESGDGAHVLAMRGITKRFPDVLANDAISLDLEAGEVHAVLGENGAGKSTLMNILCGLYRADAGEIIVHGQRLAPGSPRIAISAGIGMVHQHFMLIPVMTVTENLVLSAEPTRHGVLMDYGAARAAVLDVSRRYGLAVDPDATVAQISVAQQQRVEILRALLRGADILVLDEPTAVLTPQEARDLFDVLRQLTAAGTSIIFISHKLREVLAIADRITVLRRGKLVATRPASGATEADLAQLMVGRSVLLRVEKTPLQTGPVVLEVDGLEVRDERGLEKVRDVSFHVRSGEIVGIAGVDGNGQSELLDALTGLRRISAGSVRVAGRELVDASPADALDAGVGHIPEDRQRRGLVLQLPIADNVALHDYHRSPASRAGWIFRRRLQAHARRLIREFDVRGGGPAALAGDLSGGNQQKVVLAREIDRNPLVLIAAQPTRGLDVGAIEFIHRRLMTERDNGRAILLVSLELDEILSLADRILVMYEGRVVGEFGSDVSEPTLGLAMTGGAAT